MLSKKRQPSKKSVGSVSPEMSLEGRTQLGDTGNIAADVLVEAPSIAQLPPELDFSSTGAADSLSNGFQRSQQGKAFLSDDQNTVWTLPESATWSAETDHDGTVNPSSAPPPTDVSNVPGPNPFSWPLFTADTDWQFDFDIPWTAEHTSASTDTSSAALTELDISQSYNQPTQGSDSTGCSEELIEYLSLSEKVSIETAFFA